MLRALAGRVVLSAPFLNFASAVAMRALTSPLRPRACSRRLHSLQLRAAAAPASAATWAQAPSATPDVVRDRAKAALLGAVLADAATMRASLPS